jgi:hypothetical protein
MERGAAELMLQVRLECRRAQDYWRFGPTTPGGPPNAAA